jgi:tetratricopeptide (TPR) repeat protein
VEAVGAVAEVPLAQSEAAALKAEAVREATLLAETYPEDALTHALLGSAYYNTGQSEVAVRHLERCLEIQPGLMDAYEILARMAYEQGRLEETIRLGEAARQHGGDHQGLWEQQGRALLDLGRTQEAVEVLSEWTREGRAGGEGWYWLGQAWLQAGEYGKAKESFLMAIRGMPAHTQAYFGLYTASLRLGEAAAAAHHRRRFQELEAADRQLLTDRNAQEDTLTGLPLVRRTVSQTLFGAAQVHQGHGSMEKAAALYRRAAVLDDENPQYRAALEGHYVQRQAVAEGARVFEGLVQEQPGSGWNHYFLGRLQQRTEQYEGAEKAYRKAQELLPGRPEAYRALAELYLRLNREPVEARRMAQKAMELQPSGAHGYILAVTSLRVGDRPGALEMAREAVRLTPGEKRYRDFLQQLEATGEP